MLAVGRDPRRLVGHAARCGAPQQELTDRVAGVVQVISQIGPGGDRTASERIALATGRPVKLWPSQGEFRLLEKPLAGS